MSEGVKLKWPAVSTLSFIIKSEISFSSVIIIKKYLTLPYPFSIFQVKLAFLQYTPFLCDASRIVGYTASYPRDYRWPSLLYMEIVTLAFILLFIRSPEEI